MVSHPIGRRAALDYAGRFAAALFAGAALPADGNAQARRNVLVIGWDISDAKYLTPRE